MKSSRFALLMGAMVALLFILVSLSSCDKMGYYLPTKHPYPVKDTVKPVPPSKPISLLAGSSTFTRWTNAQSFFPNDSIINRGFGGSIIKEVTAKVKSYRDECIPNTIVIYSGTNNAFNGKSSAEMFVDFKLLHAEFVKYNPGCKILNMGLTISPRSCKEINPKTNLPIRTTIENYNRLVKEWIATQPNSQHIEMAYLFLNKDKMPAPEWFTSDSLHQVNAAYSIWATEIKKGLAK